MKTYIKILAAALAMVSLLPACKEEVIEPVHTPAVDVTTQKIEPASDESGTVRAYVGTEVTLHGFNLDCVSTVTIGGVEAEITSQTIKDLSFLVPALELAQQDNPHNVQIEVFDKDGKTSVFRYPYFVTIPVTDALVSSFSPAAGTIGTVVEIAGRNLSQVTAVKFNETEVNADEFAAGCTESLLKVALPALPYTSESTDVKIVAVWSQGDIAVTSEEKPFTMSVPVFDKFEPSSGGMRLGDEFALTGKNLDLVSDVNFGSHKLLIKDDRTSSRLNIVIPTNIGQTIPPMLFLQLTATFGAPVQTVAIGMLTVDTTPVGPAAPVFASAAPTDKSYSKIFLGREVTVTGQNMASIERFILSEASAESGSAAAQTYSASSAVSAFASSGEIEVALNGNPDELSAKFTVPETISGTAAKQMKLTAVWNGGNRTDFGEITVYPFKYTKGLKIGVGSNSASTYTDFARANAFLMLDEGSVISAQAWKEAPVDKFVFSTGIVASASKLDASAKAEDYYGVAPYIFLTTSSANKLAFQNPANSTSQLKCHRYPGNTAMPSVYGTPVIFYSVITDNADLKKSIVEGTLEDIAAYSGNASSSAPACAASETSSAFTKGSVICIQYLTYEHAHDTGGKPVERADVRKIGYLYISDITCADENGATLADRSGYIEFDLYWSTVLGE